MRAVISIVAAMAWISSSEFIRNTFFLHDHWVQHYEALGLFFPEEPINGAMWGTWALVYALTIFFLNKRFSLFETFAISWTYGFVMMWLVIGNLMVLPFSILPVAVPWSMFESFGAAWIIRVINK